MDILEGYSYEKGDDFDQYCYVCFSRLKQRNKEYIYNYLLDEGKKNNKTNVIRLGVLLREALANPNNSYRLSRYFPKSIGFDYYYLKDKFGNVDHQYLFENLFRPDLIKEYEKYVKEGLRNYGRLTNGDFLLNSGKSKVISFRLKKEDAVDKKVYQIIMAQKDLSDYMFEALFCSFLYFKCEYSFKTLVDLLALCDLRIERKRFSKVTKEIENIILSQQLDPMVFTFCFDLYGDYNQLECANVYLVLLDGKLCLSYNDDGEEYEVGDILFVKYEGTIQTSKILKALNIPYDIFDSFDYYWHEGIAECVIINPPKDFPFCDNIGEIKERYYGNNSSDFYRMTYKLGRMNFLLRVESLKIFKDDKTNKIQYEIIPFLYNHTLDIYNISSNCPDGYTYVVVSFDELWEIAKDTELDDEPMGVCINPQGEYFKLSFKQVRMIANF